MKASLLLLGSILLCSGVLQAAGVCTSPDTMTLGCIYSNLGPGETYIDGTGLSPAYLADAVPFTPTASYVLRDIEIAAYRANADVPDSVRFSIYQEVSGAPGYDPVSGFPGTGLLESFTLTGLGIFGGDPAPGTVTAQSVLHPALSAGVRYWIVMDGVNPGDVTWNDNAASQFGVATV
ncbi:MAG TPA: choice-of-anchor R domain-containing protein, partial [Bryobacteraceae bacterium]|nr:choice-of-anchor R domain-containing protein [Bryobacteraceae bacterium]